MEFGPLLYFRDIDSDRLRLAALILRPAERPCAEIETDLGTFEPEILAEIGGRVVWRITFDLPAGGVPEYHFEGQSYPVRTDYETDLRIGFASCNGEENGDLDRDAGERNLMWARMADAHERAPFHLLLQGGDQIYADEAGKAHPLTEDWPNNLQKTVSPADLAAVSQTLRLAFFQRYCVTFSGQGFTNLAAQVPSLMIWDDHDICDGWGSLGAEVTDHPLGQCLFAAAREMYLIFQMAMRPSEADALLLDPEASSLSWRRDLPGVTILAPDLRSERRRDRVMDQTGWACFEAATADVRERVLLISSVPLLGPRLSLVERFFLLTRRMEKYEDDLRDQWQSRAHRTEWQKMLRHLIGMQERGIDITAISGEIHVATRAEMKGGDGRTLHQLVSSGIAHRSPPKAYSLGLGMLSRLGEAPLSGHPIRIRPLPGRFLSYTGQRNFLVIERREGAWRAAWELERAGRTPWMEI